MSKVITKVILLNGPASSGKDTLGEQLILMPNVKLRSFKSAIVEMILRIYSLPRKRWDEWYTTEGKEHPRAIFDGKSQRETLIHMSENVGKPIFGKDVWSKAMANTMPDDGSIYVITDSGFVEEAQVLVDKFGAENVHVVKLFRKGKSFKGDSRRYLHKHELVGSSFMDVDLSPMTEGETHRGVTKKVAESIYTKIVGTSPYSSKLYIEAVDSMIATCLCCDKSDITPIKSSNK